VPKSIVEYRPRSRSKPTSAGPRTFATRACRRTST
jgi:hypothetical protein